MHRLDVTVARQPVLDLTGACVGYSLRYRQGSAGPTAGLRQNSPALIRGTLAVGLTRLVGELDAYFAVGADVLDGSVPAALPPDRSILMVESDVVADERIVAHARTLVDRGFRLAVEHRADTPEARALRGLASIVKIDVGFADDAQLADARRVADEQDAKLFAYRVPAKAPVGAGVDLFQRSVPGSATVETAKWLEPTSGSGMSEVSSLLAAGASVEEQVDVMRGDVAVVVHMMLLATAVADRTTTPIGSIEDALRHVGRDRLARWLGVLAARPLPPGADLHDERVTVLMRARACELLAPESDRPTAFAAGLLSGLNVLLDEPTDQLLGRLWLTPELTQAASGAGPGLPELVTEVVEAQRAGRAQGLRYPAADVDAALAQAFHWALDRVDGLPE